MTGYAEIGQGEDLIGILVHLDVVPAGGWISPPFELREKEGGLTAEVLPMIKALPWL